MNIQQLYVTLILDSADEGSEWVECMRCKQRYHCKCIGISIEEANLMECFYCP